MLKYDVTKCKTIKKRWLFPLLIILISILLPMDTLKAERAATEGGTTSNNKSNQNYSTWSSPMYSNLYENEDHTLTRVECIDDKIIYENYDKNYKLLKKDTIKKELSLYGGFYSGKDANYFVFGQTNSKQSKTCEVIRVVKYSKDWKRIASCSLKDCNTTVPFDAGSLRFAESGDMLYIRTSHEMYKSSDGYNHQANLTFSVNTDTMEITDSYSIVMNIGYGYVSHSFNQFIQVNGKELLAVDHGDAYPRSIALIKYEKSAGETTFTGKCSSIDLLEFPGSIGANATGGSVGGFEVSSSSYLVVGNYDNTSASVRNVFLSVTPQGTLTDGNTKLLYLTKYKKNSKARVSTPQLVKITDDSFMVLWEVTNTDTYQQEVNYVIVNGKGETVTKVGSMTGNLSDCQPIVYNDKVTWYFTNDSTPVFCTVPTDGTAAKDNLVKGDQFTVKKITYSIIKSTSKTKTVAVNHIEDISSTKITIPSTIKINGATYKVTEVYDQAFDNCYYTKTIVFGSNITKIGNLGLPSWNNVQKIQIKTTKLKTVKKKAFSEVSDSAVIEVPKSKLSVYKKLLKGKGQSSKVKITKL
ncbi:leucine-rich repeat protein [Anaerosporobacter faecicola]|uniref:leucine-rich repeat protein n=1 Tax=Anaerosporobacter faecicola TaxID=2718714 RepID=UPI001438CEF1|nr:leucine-rich repeat protein [Anaerosporobacter faecicola]